MRSPISEIKPCVQTDILSPDRTVPDCGYKVVTSDTRIMCMRSSDYCCRDGNDSELIIATGRSGLWRRDQ